MISKMLSSTNPAYYEFSEQELARIDPAHYPDLFDETIYESDEFRMYGFKIKRCPRVRSHDWTQCPFAHRGEKARRRDPRRYNYAAVVCPEFRTSGECRRGDACQFAHGVFEYWLHPARYRTRACNAGPFCTRRVCFFAHTSHELRDEGRYQCVYRVRPTDGGGDGIVKLEAAPVIPVVTAVCGGGGGVCGGNADFLASLSGLEKREGGVGDGDGTEKGVLGWYVAAEAAVVPDIDWITEIVD